MPFVHRVFLGHRDRGGGDHDQADSQQRKNREHQRTVDGYPSGRIGIASCLSAHRGHQRTFSVARPTSTSITATIQKRTITFGSGQPLSSKWGWMGAMRKM